MKEGEQRGWERRREGEESRREERRAGERKGEEEETGERGAVGQNQSLQGLPQTSLFTAI